MSKFEIAMISWNIMLTCWVFVHGLKFGLVQRILNQIVMLLAASKKSKIDALYGRD